MCGSDYCYVHSFRKRTKIPFFKKPEIHILITAIIGIAIGYYFFHIGPTKENQEKMLTSQKRAEDKLQSLEAKVDAIAKAASPYLNKQYPDGAIAFGISEKGFIVPKGQFSDILNVDWGTGSVIEVTETKVLILLPEITDNFRYLKFMNIKIIIPKKIGFRFQPMPYKEGDGFFIEVIGIDRDFVVVGLGYIRPK